MAVPYTFANATSAIPLSQLDSNFATAVTIGNVAIQLGNTATTLSNLSLANVTITSSSISNVSVGSTANAVVYAPTTSTLATNANLKFDGTNLQVANSLSSANTFGFKNRIINGGMVIDQRNAGASVTIPTATSTYTLDRWFAYATIGSKFSVQQNAGSVTPPAGFTNYLGCTSLSSYSVGASETFDIQYRIEGYNTADLGWGTANAKTVTLSFQVYSSLTGSFGGSLYNSATNRWYPFSYTISTANTWTSASVTIAGDTSGTWLTTNGVGIGIIFSLGIGSTLSGTAGAWTGSTYLQPTGSVSVVGTSGATFYITGVQLEVGTQATSFDFRPYTTELNLCQRYLPAFVATTTTSPLPGIATALGTNCVLIFNHPVPARVQGTGVTVSSNSHFNFSNNDGNSASTAVSFAAGSPNATQLSITVAVTRGVTTTPGWFYANNATAYLYVTGCEL